jgi:hypothetical protein
MEWASSTVVHEVVGDIVVVNQSPPFAVLERLKVRDRVVGSYAEAELGRPADRAGDRQRDLQADGKRLRSLPFSDALA